MGISITFLFSLQRKLALYGDQISFISITSIQNPISTFIVSSVVANDIVWDVTQPFKAKKQSVLSNETTFTFSTSTDSLKRFVVFDPTKISSPQFESTIVNQNLHGITSADLLIISHPSLLSQATRLANHRQSHDQLSSVVLPQNQFLMNTVVAKLTPLPFAILSKMFTKSQVLN